MENKIIIKILFILFLFSNLIVKANDISAMGGISEAAGGAAQAAADQLASDAGKVSENIAGATEALGKAKSDIGKALDASIAQAETAMEFAQESLAKGDITGAVQAMTLVEGVADMALDAVPEPTSLDMSGIDFEFTNSYIFLENNFDPTGANENSPINRGAYETRQIEMEYGSTNRRKFRFKKGFK